MQKEKLYHNKQKSRMPKKLERKIYEDVECKGEKQSSFQSNSLKLLLRDDNDDLPLAIVEEKKKRKSQNEDICTEVMDFIVKSNIDDCLQKVAEKKQLTSFHVKNIIKEVVTDKSVVAMLHSTVHGFDPSNPYSAPVYEPKLTRSKMRKLNEKQFKLKSERQTMRNNPQTTGSSSQELEVEPHLLKVEPRLLRNFPFKDDDDLSHPEDQQIMRNDISPSLINMPPGSSESNSLAAAPTVLPETNQMCSTLQSPKSPSQNCLNFSAIGSPLICSHTSSKFPMTNTSLESLEKSFEPFDITSDMDETQTEDAIWKKFLLDCTQQSPEDTGKGEDEQVDPEYNILADDEEELASLEDIKEEFRRDKAVKVTKKEFNELMADYCDSFQKEEREQVHYISSDDRTSCMRNVHPQSTVSCSVVELTKEHAEILKWQLAQHIQFLTQSVLMTSYEERFQFIENGCKTMFNEIFSNAESWKSIFPINLEAALETVHHYDSKRDDFIHIIKAKKEKNRETYGVGAEGRNYSHCFADCIEKLLLESRGLLFPNLLPRSPFHSSYVTNSQKNKKQKPFLESEYYLLASSFCEVGPDLKVFHVKEKKGVWEDGSAILALDPALSDICRRVAMSGHVFTTGPTLDGHLRRILKLNYKKGHLEDNPLIKFMKTGKVDLPKAKIEPPPLNTSLPLKDVDPVLLPGLFQKMIAKHASKGKRTTRKESSKDTIIKVSRRRKEKMIYIERGKETKILVESTLPTSSHEWENQDV